MPTQKFNPGLQFGAGSVVQSNIGYWTANWRTSAVIPQDDTIPQNTEGAELVTVSITPKSAKNYLRVVFSGGNFYLDTASNWHMTVALFRDSTADAIASAWGTVVSYCSMGLTMNHRVVAGSTSPTTFKVRAGPYNATPTIAVNGVSSRVYGGTCEVSLYVEEIAA